LKQLLADVWDRLEAITTCLRLVVLAEEDADQLQTLEYLKIDRSAGMAKILVRGRIADGLGFEDKAGWYTIARQLGVANMGLVHNEYDLEGLHGCEFPLEGEPRVVKALILQAVAKLYKSLFDLTVGVIWH
jgi:hypothetical protein